MQQNKSFSVEKLVTTLNSDVKRISMHGVREQLLLQQAKSVNLPIQIIPLAGNVSMESYNKTMESETKKLVSEGFTHGVFGDIFLEDLKEYREKQLGKVGLKPIFPLWKKDTSVLIREFLQAGFKAITVCVNAKLLDKSFCGRLIDEQFLAHLPKEVDSCGENGEFHTFVYDGPNFKFPIKFEKGEITLKTYDSGKSEKWDTQFWFCDLLHG